MQSKEESKTIELANSLEHHLKGESVQLNNFGSLMCGGIVLLVIGIDKVKKLLLS